MDTGIVIGTRKGVFRASEPVFGTGVEKALDSGVVNRVKNPASFEGVFAATGSGLYRSLDAGKTWDDLGVPRGEVFSVAASPDGDRIYAGTHPAHIYVSEDGGRNWRELEDFQNLSSRDRWHTPRHRNKAHVRSLGVHPDDPDRIVAGVEVGGVHVSYDKGETWHERRNGVHADVHHVLVMSPDEYIASTGRGLYKTTDSGKMWKRIDTDNHLFWYTYNRETFYKEGVLYASPHDRAKCRFENEMEAILIESEDEGESFEEVNYPTEPEEYAITWSSVGDWILAGTVGYLSSTASGHVLVNDDEWRIGGKVPEYIRSICKTRRT